MKVNDKTLKTEDIDAVNKLIDAEEAQLALAEAEELQNKLDLFKESQANPWGYSPKGQVAKSAAMAMLSTKSGLYARIPITFKGHGFPYS